MTDGEATASPGPVDGSTGAVPPGVAALYAELAVELHRLVLGVVRDPELAEDVMQATFVKAAEQGHQARAETARGWLFRVALHEALAAKRRQASRDRGDRRLAGLRPAPPAGPDAGLIRSEAVQAVRQALGGLSEDQLRVVRARVFEEKTFAEIASETGLPLGTVLTRMRRALEKMRRTLRSGE
jgi:RNA polymerase sigma factor (sigma-70 family)